RDARGASADAGRVPAPRHALANGPAADVDRPDERLGAGRVAVEVPKGQGDVKLTRDEFERRLRERFFDPAFQTVDRKITDVINVAWKVYDEYHKSPRKRKAGPGFAEPDFELPIEWLDTRERIRQAEREYKDAARPGRMLLVCGAARHDQTCPGEMSKSFRLASQAREEIERAGLHCDFLDLSLL